jgi:tetratricopeptide (TPR) repeat protein
LLASVDEKAGNFVVAVNEYQEAAHLDPSESNLFDWGSELLVHQTPEPAIQDFSEGVKRHPDSPRLALGLGLALDVRGAYDDAVQALLRGVDLDPSDARAYYFVSELLRIFKKHHTCKGLRLVADSELRRKEGRPGAPERFRGRPLDERVSEQ